MAVRVLLVLVALVTFYGCGQSSPAPEQGEEAVGGNKPERTEPKNTPKPETTARVAPGYTASEQASADAAKAAAADAEVTHDQAASASAARFSEMNQNDCRIQQFAIEEGMSEAEYQAWTDEMVEAIARDFEEGGDFTVKDWLDQEGVPAYKDPCG